MHTDHLTPADLHSALREAGLQDVSVETITRGSRKRARAIDFRLAAEPKKGRRRRNTGRYGAEDAFQEMYQAAATWDEHGAFFAVLFDRDPEAIIGHYVGRQHFHDKTQEQYRRVEA